MGIGLAATLLLGACGSLSSEELAQKEESPESPNPPPAAVEPDPSIAETTEPELDEPVESEQPERSQNGDSSFDLLPSFYPDPVTSGGTVSGTVEASIVTGTDTTASGSCEGFISESPDHQVNLRDDFSYLTLGVESSSPVSLVVVGDGGDSWCATGLNPRVEEEAWAQGRYNIYVGNPDGPEDGEPYELSISEINPNFNGFGAVPFEEGTPGNDAYEGGDYQPISVAPGFEPDPAIGTGNVGGPLLASDVTGVVDTETGECNGYIDTQADHYLTLEQPFRYLKVLAESPSPTSLVIVGPQGESWCHTGNNPFIEGVWDEGEYEVYLSNLDGADVGDRYELLVTELD